jgi:nitrite reductase (NO-forming)
VGVAAASAAGAVAGYGIAAMDDQGTDRGAEATPGQQGALPEGPKPSGKIAVARDATLPPVAPSPLQLTYRVTDSTVEIAGGVMYNAWTFEDTVPGPVLHVRQGDTIKFTLRNEASGGHSIDFHAARTPWDKNYVTVVPGDSLSFDWSADFPGVFVYHCGTAPVLHHIANGMYGLIIVDPETPFEAAREYWLLQSEFYAQPGANNTWDGSMEKMLTPRPDIVAFNGAAFQYKDNPLPVSAGEKIRLYVGNIGPTLFSAFHVIGALFDTTYIDGNPRNPLYGLQTHTIAPGAGATFELTIPEAGLYPFVTHSFAYTELGAVGLLEAK